MKKYISIIIGSLFLLHYPKLFSQNLNLSETVQYINEKLSAYPVRISQSHDYFISSKIILSGNNLTVIETNKNLTNGDISTTVFKVNPNNLMPNAQIDKAMNSAHSINIVIYCKNRANNVETTITYPSTSSTLYYNLLNISIGTNEENAQYLCNAFNHLITLFNEENKTTSSDPFANYEKDQSKKQTSQETKQINVSESNVKTLSPNTPQIYKSTIYGYSIKIPPGFKRTAATGKHIDLKLQSPDGSSILINVSPRLPAEMKITAHDYTKEFFEETFKQNNDNTRILESENIYIADCKAFQIVYINQNNYDLKAYEIYFFRGNYAYVLTATTVSTQFTSYLKVFKDTFNSLTFN